MPNSTDKRPRIIVTGPDNGGAVAWLFSRLAITLAGGRAARVTPSVFNADCDFDGLVIGGGADVDPGLYGKSLEPMPAAPSGSLLLRWLFGLVFYPLLLLARRLFSSKQYSGLDNARDQMEYRLLGLALDQNKPVLGICRGAQLINVYLKGNLHQNIEGFYTETPQIWSVRPVKPVNIQPDSRLHAILGTLSCRVNALHRQSIDQIGRHVRISARDANGIIQAIEHDRHPFLLGVQWHPEYLPHHARQRRLFDELVRTARDSRQHQHGGES
jgi:putative glutamine amidotransferase